MLIILLIIQMSSDGVLWKDIHKSQVKENFHIMYLLKDSNSYCFPAQEIGGGAKQRVCYERKADFNRSRKENHGK